MALLIIDECAKSNVHDLDLELTVDWLDEGTLNISYYIKNLEEISEQMFEINRVRGGFKRVKVLVENSGENDASNVDWQILIKGGLFDRINTAMTGNIEHFPSGDEKNIRAKAKLFQIYGFGSNLIFFGK